MTLGTGSISPLEMAAAYATFANGGYYRQPIAITEIDSRTGSVLYQHTDNPSQVLTEGEAAAVTDVLSGVMQGGGTGAAGALSVNQPYAGKTGTTDNTTNLWFCGYTPQLACALWTGYSAGEIPIQKYGTDLLGDSTNLPVFKRFMNTVLTGTEREEFATRNGAHLQEQQRLEVLRHQQHQEDGERRQGRERGRRGNHHNDHHDDHDHRDHGRRHHRRHRNDRWLDGRLHWWFDRRRWRHAYAHAYAHSRPLAHA